MPTTPAGSGFALVITGGSGPLTTRLKTVGPELPAALVAVTLMVAAAAEGGVPVKSPVELSEAQPGRPVALQVTESVPVAANWKEYGVPTRAAGSGLVLVITGGTGSGGAAEVIVKLNGVEALLPPTLVAVTFRFVTAAAFGVPVNSPAELSVAQPGRPVALQAIEAVPLAVNW